MLHRTIFVFMDIPGLPIKLPLRDLSRLRGAWTSGLSASSKGDGRLTEVARFGADPGGLRMLCYLPPGLRAGAPLVVVLHGCTQTAGGFDAGTGWSVLAERHGFALLMPEQRRANNAHLCFNWFEAEDTTRGGGEVASVRAMVAHMVAANGLDATRVFVCGLSAGGAMTAALLATYPDCFAGGAVIAGLPYRAATGVRNAMAAMSHCPDLPAAAWGDRVRQAAPKPIRRPRVAIWHGDADSTVKPGNALASAKQWCDVAGLDERDGVEDRVEGTLHRTWRDPAGIAQVELFVVPGLAHGVPVDTAAAGDRSVGQAMPYLLEAGVSATWHIARNWGLVPDSPAASTRTPPKAAGAREVIAKALQAVGLPGV